MPHPGNLPPYTVDDFGRAPLMFYYEVTQACEEHLADRRRHPVITFHVRQHLLVGVAGLSRDDTGDALARAQNLLRLDGDVGCGPASASASCCE